MSEMSALRPHGHDHAHPNGALAAVSRELTRLDPFSFFVIDGGAFGAEHVVVGSTGAFVIHVGEAAVDGRIRWDVSAARKACRRARRQAGDAAISTAFHPVLCLPGRPFEHFTRGGVKVIPWSSVVHEVAARPRRANLHQVRRIADKLGAPALRRRDAASA